MTKEEAIKYLQQLYPNGGHCWLDEQRIEAIGIAIKALQEEPASEQKLSNVQRIVKDWKEPVSEELEKAADTYIKTHGEILGFGKQTFKAGARWQKKQDQSTIELAEDHAMLAGMEKMKDKMMEKAIDGDITFDYYGDDDKTYGCIAHDSFCLEDFGMKDRDKVKMILIKE